MSESTINVMTKDDLDAFWSKLKGWFVKAPTATVTADTVALFDGTTGKIIKSSGKTIETSATQSSSNLITSGAVWTGLDGKLSTTLKGAANGLAELDANGLVPSSQLPSYVDDVLEYSSKSAFPATGTSGKIYVALDTNLTYRWSGTAYVEISPSLALGETSSTAYRGDRGAIAYSHATDANRLTTAQTSGFYKFATTAEGHIKSVTAVTASDLTTLIGNTTYAPYHSGGYVTLDTAQTVTGAKTISNSELGGGLDIRRDAGASTSSALRFSNNGGTLGYLGINSSGVPKLWNSDASASYTIWHAGNDGSGSGLDADLLDGQHGSYFVAKNTIEKSGENLIEGSSSAIKNSHWSSTGWSGGISTYDASSGVYEVYAYNGWGAIVYQLPDEYLGKTLAFSVDLYYDSDKSTQALTNEFCLIKAKEYKTASNTILTIGTSLPAKTWTHYTGTFVANSDVAYFGFFIRCADSSGKYTYIRARNLKVELGEVQSAWTPAHKDLCFSNLGSNTTNAVSLTIGDVTKNITPATLRTSLGLGSVYSHSHNDYVTNIGVSGDTLTWNKGGVAQDAITVPYAKKTSRIIPYGEIYVDSGLANKYKKIGSLNLTQRYQRASITLLYRTSFYTGANNAGEFGFIHLMATQSSAIGSRSQVTFKQIGNNTRTQFYVTEDVTESQTSINLYVKVANTYDRVQFTNISSESFTTAIDTDWLDSLPTSTYSYTPSFNFKVGFADKLTTARTIWGRSFDGSADVKGVLSNARGIEFSGLTSSDSHGGVIDFHFAGSSDDNTSRIWEDENGRLNINYSLYVNKQGNVGIGTSSPSERLAVNGNAIVYGKVTASNDITSVRNVVGLGGVAAHGIATLDLSGGSIGVTQVNVGSTAYTPTNGIVSLPAYPTWSTLSGKPSLAAVATSGDYDDLSNKPTNLSDFTNDASYLTNMAFETKGGVGTVTGKVNTFTYCTSLAFTTFTATLPTITDTTKCYVVMFYVHWKSGYNAYNITSSHTVSFMHDFSIVAGGAYFIKAVFAGRWYVSAERVE